MKLTLEQEALKAAALATDGAKWETEGFEQTFGNGTFYGGLIMHGNGHTIIAQQVLSPHAEFIAHANPAAILALLARLEAAQEAPTAEPCPNAAHMGEHACLNRHQCFEPCGELGQSAEHAKPASKEVQGVVDLAVGKGAPVDERAKPAWQIVAGLQGIANHVRAVPEYRHLLGDMDIVDEAIAALQQPGQAVPDAERDARNADAARWKFWRDRAGFSSGPPDGIPSLSFRSIKVSDHDMEGAHFGDDFTEEVDRCTDRAIAQEKTS